MSAAAILAAQSPPREEVLHALKRTAVCQNEKVSPYSACHSGPTVRARWFDEIAAPERRLAARLARIPRSGDVSRPARLAPSLVVQEVAGNAIPESLHVPDYTILDMIDAMLEAARCYRHPKDRAPAKKGGDSVPPAQVSDPPPAWACVFEPRSVTGAESQSILLMMLVLHAETGDRKCLVPGACARAVDYLKASALRPDQLPPIRRRARNAPTGSGDLVNWRNASH